jgi:hypothetical protein
VQVSKSTDFFFVSPFFPLLFVLLFLVSGELAGYGATCDAHHITTPAPGGAGLAKAIEVFFFYFLGLLFLGFIFYFYFS